MPSIEDHHQLRSHRSKGHAATTRATHAANTRCLATFDAVSCRSSNILTISEEARFRSSRLSFFMLISSVFWGQTEEVVETSTRPTMPDEVVHYEAEDIYFSVDSGLGFLTGHARVVSGSMELMAHRIVLRLDDNEVCALARRTAWGNGWVAPNSKKAPSRSPKMSCVTILTQGRG